MERRVSSSEQSALPAIVVAVVAVIPLVAIIAIAVVAMVAGLLVDADDDATAAAKHHARAGRTIVAIVATIRRVISAIVIPAR